MKITKIPATITPKSLSIHFEKAELATLLAEHYRTKGGVIPPGAVLSLNGGQFTTGQHSDNTYILSLIITGD